MLGLYIQKSRHFLQRNKNFKPGWIHSTISRSESIIFINLLKSIKTRVQNGQRALDHSAIFQRIDIAGMHSTLKMTSFRARSVAGDTLSVDIFFIGRTYSDASSAVFEQMFGTVSNTGGAISVFSVGIFLPFEFDGIVLFHWRTLLFANTVVVKIPAGLKEMVIY